MKTTQINIFLIAISIFAFSCTEPFDIDVDMGESQLVVDGFISSQPKLQSIVLSKTVDFFEANTPPAATGAKVFLVNQNGKVWNFDENLNKLGHYEWQPNLLSPDSSDFRIGSIGDTINLFISYENDTFTSLSILKRTTSIDSVEFFFEPESTFNDEGYYAELRAVDRPGQGDIYWFRTWVNGIYLSKAAEINVAYDASFSPGADTDGIPFILPIRRGINPVNDDEDEVRNDPNQYIPKVPFTVSDTIIENGVQKIIVGDSVYVEIWSINESTLAFLQQIQSEVNNGGLFATPPTNVRTNIFNINPNSTTKAVGQFCVSSVSSGSNKL